MKKVITKGPRKEEITSRCSRFTIILNKWSMVETTAQS
jgi:hypothetical protein